MDYIQETLREKNVGEGRPKSIVEIRDGIQIHGVQGRIIIVVEA